MDQAIEAIVTTDDLDAEIDWRRFIEVNPEILVGKPVVAGTRLGAEFLLRLFAAGWTREEVLDSYPSLTPDALRAVFAMAAEILGEEYWSAFPPQRSE